MNPFAKDLQAAKEKADLLELKKSNNEAYQKKFCVAVEYEVTVDGPIGHEEVSIAEIPVWEIVVIITSLFSATQVQQPFSKLSNQV